MIDVMGSNSSSSVNLTMGRPSVKYWRRRRGNINFPVWYWLFTGDTGGEHVPSVSPDLRIIETDPCHYSHEGIIKYWGQNCLQTSNTPKVLSESGRIKNQTLNEWTSPVPSIRKVHSFIFFTFSIDCVPHSILVKCDCEGEKVLEPVNTGPQCLNWIIEIVCSLLS